MIYLNNHSATPICGPARELLRSEDNWNDFFSPNEKVSFGGPLSVRYQMIYDLAGAAPDDQFVFTSSGSEAICQVHWTAFLEMARKEGKCHFITTPVEDAPILQSLKRLEELGCFVKIAPLRSNGRVDVEKLAALINPKTAMISLSLAHGLTGVIQPIEEILACKKDALLHLDVTYALGKLYCPDADYITFSGDRIHGPKGSGGLFAKKGRPLVPFIFAKSFDTPSFMGLSAAASQAALSLDLMGLETARLRNRLETIGTVLLRDHRLPNVTVLAFPGVHQESLHYMLQRKGVFGSIGGDYSPYLSRHLIAAGIDEKVAETAIHFSLSRNTTEDEIDRAIKIIEETTATLRALSHDL